MDVRRAALLVLSACSTEYRVVTTPLEPSAAAVDYGFVHGFFARPPAIDIVIDDGETLQPTWPLGGRCAWTPDGAQRYCFTEYDVPLEASMLTCRWQSLGAWSADAVAATVWVSCSCEGVCDAWMFVLQPALAVGEAVQ